MQPRLNFAKASQEASLSSPTMMTRSLSPMSFSKARSRAAIAGERVSRNVTFASL